MMPPDYHYTSALGAIIRQEVVDARKAGMPISKITAELGDIYIECLWAAITERQMKEAQQCVN